MDDLNLYFDTSPEVYIPAETRGQMLLTPEGIEPAAIVVPPPGAPGAAPAQPAAQTDEKKPAAAPDDEGEPEGAEVEEGDRVLRLRRRDRLRIINGN